MRVKGRTRSHSRSLVGVQGAVAKFWTELTHILAPWARVHILTPYAAGVHDVMLALRDVTGHDVSYSRGARPRAAAASDTRSAVSRCTFSAAFSCATRVSGG